MGAEGVDLFAQEVELFGEGGVAGGVGGVVVEVAVVALGEAGDAVDVGVAHGEREGAGVEVARDVGDVGAGVEVKVDLAGTDARRAPVEPSSSRISRVFRTPRIRFCES